MPEALPTDDVIQGASYDLPPEDDGYIERAAPSLPDSSQAYRIPKGWSTHTMSVAGVEREYTVYRPPFFGVDAMDDGGYTIPGLAPADPERKYLAWPNATRSFSTSVNMHRPKALVLCLHGWDSTSSWACGSMCQPHAAELGYIAICPQALKARLCLTCRFDQRATSKSLRTASVGWSTNDAPQYAARWDADDVGFIDKVIGAVRGALENPPKHTYVMGYSSGGAMALRLSCELTNLITGFGSVGISWASAEGGVGSSWRRGSFAEEGEDFGFDGCALQQPRRVARPLWMGGGDADPKFPGRFGAPYSKREPPATIAEGATHYALGVLNCSGVGHLRPPPPPLKWDDREYDLDPTKPFTSLDEIVKEAEGGAQEAEGGAQEADSSQTGVEPTGGGTDEQRGDLSGSRRLHEGPGWISATGRVRCVTWSRGCSAPLRICTYRGVGHAYPVGENRSIVVHESRRIEKAKEDGSLIKSELDALPAAWAFWREFWREQLSDEDSSAGRACDPGPSGRCVDEAAETKARSQRAQQEEDARRRGHQEIKEKRAGKYICLSHTYHSAHMSTLPLPPPCLCSICHRSFFSLFSLRSLSRGGGNLTAAATAVDSLDAAALPAIVYRV